MSGFIKGEDRHQATLFPERLDDYIAEDSAVRVIDVFLDDLDLSGLGLRMTSRRDAEALVGYNAPVVDRVYYKHILALQFHSFVSWQGARRRA